MNRQEFWDVIEQARADVGSAAADAVAARASESLALLPNFICPATLPYFP